MKINQSIEAQNPCRMKYAAAGACAMPAMHAPFVRDNFTYSAPRVNPAAQNPFYILNDEILANAFPQALINKYTSPAFLVAAASTNPNITNILNQTGTPLCIYPENIYNSISSHFMPTLKFAHQIMDGCEEKFTKKQYATMAQGALLHDAGKAFIPSAILNKNGKLNDYERKVVDTHAQLGYEALKSGGVSAPVLSLIKNHHSYGGANTTNDPLVQILEIADIYSALKEARPYKESFGDEKAFAILYERAQKGDFDKKYVDALKKSPN